MLAVGRSGGAAVARGGTDQVLSLQRLVGNRATSRLLLQRLLPQDLKSQEETAQTSENVAGQTGNLSNVLGIPSVVTGTVTGANSNNAVQGSGGVSTGGVGLILSGVSLGADSVDLHQRTKQWKSVRTDQNRKGLKRVYGRQKNIAGGNVSSDVGGVVSGGSSIMSGGMGIASQIGTATTAAAGIGGVVGAAITMPIQIGMMIRQIRRAELQRQRMSRLQDQRKNLSAKTPTGALKEKTDNFDRDKGALDKLTVDLEGLKTKHEESVRELQRLETTRALRGGLARQRRKVTSDEDDPTTTFNETDEQRDTLARNKQAVEDNKKALDELTRLRDEATVKLDTSKQELDGQQQINDTLETEVSKSGKLTDQGEADKSMPSLQEIADYAIKKNKRGWGRRSIGAAAAGVGVVAGGIGIAAAVEVLKGNSGLGTDLGIAAGAVAGLAAVVGIGVGIWKLVSWAKKRKAQAKKMEEAHKKNTTSPLPQGTYNPFKSNVDQSTQRKHMATALYNYAIHGTSDQRSEAFKVMKALDKKLDWETELKQDKNTDPVERDAVIGHIAAKMGSGG